MHEQTLIDLQQVSDILDRRRYELAELYASYKEGVKPTERYCICERPVLTLLHFLVRVFIK